MQVLQRAMLLTIAAAAFPASAAPDCTTEPIRSTGTTYYYCDCQAGSASGCSAGNDASNGTSAATARRTLGNAATRFNGMGAGDTVALCRGGAWSAGQTNLVNSSCTAGSPCDLRDYAPSWGAGAGNPRPIINFGTATRGFQVGQITGLRLWNLDVQGADRATGGVNLWMSGPALDVDMCNVRFSNGDAGVVEQANNERVTIRNSQFYHLRQQGILAGSIDLLIDSNYFYDAGSTAGSQYHTIYVQGGALPAIPSDGVHNTDGVHPGGYWNERVVNNEIHVGTETGLPCNGTVIVAHGRHWDTLIQNNYVYAHSAGAGCYLVGIGGGQGGGGYIDAVWMMRTVVDRNVLFGEGSGEGISVGTCSACSVTNNSIVLTARNSGYGWRGIAIGDSTPARAGLTPPEQGNDSVKVQNNSIYTGDTGAQGGAVVMGTEGGNYVLENNATWGLTTGWNAGGTSCLSSTRPLNRPMAGNYCQSTSVPVAGVFRDWNANDLRPANGSPLIGIGSSVDPPPLALNASWSPSGGGEQRVLPIDSGAYAANGIPSGSSSSSSSSSSSGGGSSSSSSSSSGGSSSSGSSSSGGPAGGLSTTVRTGGPWSGIRVR
jgi:uncharacterized membrane protein YgcG